MRVLKDSERRWLFVGLLAVCSVGIEAAPAIYQATGTKEQIEPVIDQFKHDIIYGPGGDQQDPPALLGSFHIATFDDLGAGLTTSRITPWRVTSGGVTVHCNPFGERLLLSSGTDDTDPNRLFGDIDPSYPAEFEAFSSPSILAVQFGPPGHQELYLNRKEGTSCYDSTPKQRGCSRSRCS